VPAKPDATLAELRDGLATSAALATIWRELNQLGLTLKKRYTRTNSAVLMSPRHLGSGARGTRRMTRTATCSSTNLA
jgi:hypothetical protein